MTDDRDALAETAAATEPQAGNTPPGAVPDKIGRFVVDGVLGRGGMGLVLAAHDPDLDRKVAIKLLHGDGGGTVGRTRLMREAQAMARLRHPNVVTVHEAGTHDGQLYVAMELVPGGTVRTWMDAHPRAGVDEVLAMFTPAGRGLAAAHAAGLVHRDFKPENVLLDHDGRVLVTDFGLAGVQGAPSAPSESMDRTDREPALHQTLTRTGDVMGTPRYMSPEQHRGEATDARTDQFAYCASLYEALYGVRAFAGDSYEVIRCNAELGEVTPPPGDRDVPARIHDAVRRGLRVDAAERWPSMQALLDALSPVAAVSTPRGWILPVAAVVALGAVLGAVVLWPRDRDRTPAPALTIVVDAAPAPQPAPKPRSTSGTVPGLCFDGAALRANTEPLLDRLAAALRAEQIHELVIEVYVAPGTENAYATAEARGDAVLQALFDRDVKSYLIVDVAGGPAPTDEGDPGCGADPNDRIRVRVLTP